MVPQVGPAEVLGLIEHGALVLDVREPAEWAAGRIAGSRHVPMSDLPAAWLDLPTSPSTVVVCRSGVRSDAVAAALDETGRPGCVNLSGGLKAWIAAGLPLDPPAGYVA